MRGEWPLSVNSEHNCSISLAASDTPAALWRYNFLRNVRASASFSSSTPPLVFMAGGPLLMGFPRLGGNSPPPPPQKKYSLGGWCFFPAVGCWKSLLLLV